MTRSDLRSQRHLDMQKKRHFGRLVGIAVLMVAVVSLSGLGAASALGQEIKVSSKPLPTEAWAPPCSPECEIIMSPREGVEYEGGGPGGGLTPQELREAYKLPSTGGSTSTIAIVDGPGDPYAESDLKEYRKHYGLPECTEANGCFKQLNEKGEPPQTDVGRRMGRRDFTRS